MPRVPLEERIQREIEKVDVKIQKLEIDKKDLLEERDKLIKARHALEAEPA